MPKSVTFLYTNSEIREKGEGGKSLLKLHQKKKKKKNTIGINLTKEVKDLYAEHYKTFIKEIEDDSKK